MEEKTLKQRRWSNQALQEWLDKIYQVLQSEKCEIILAKLRYDAGMCTKNDDGTYQIKLNPYTLDFFNTVIHETLHVIDFKMPHKEINWLAARIVKRMSLDQYAKLIILLGKKLERTYQ